LDKGKKIKKAFINFYKSFCRDDIEKAIEFFSCFGKSEPHFRPDPQKDLLDNLFDLLHHYHRIKPHIDSQYAYFLAAFATGDRKIPNTIKKCFFNETSGYRALESLIGDNYLIREPSRERLPPKTHPKQRRKKELRGYRIQHKVRFATPFMRFWYRFLYPNEELILTKRFDDLIAIILDDLENFVSLFFEELSDELLKEKFKKTIKSGSYWDRKVELDIVLELEDGRVVVGECKWKNSKVCKKTLTSLQKKAAIAGLDPCCYALFSKSGFSNELLKNRPSHILLFDLEDFKEWSAQKAHKRREKKPYSFGF